VYLSVIKYTCIYMYSLNICIHTHTHTPYICIYVYTYSLYMYTFVFRIYVHTHTPYICTHAHTHTHTHTQAGETMIPAMGVQRRATGGQRVEWGYSDQQTIFSSTPVGPSCLGVGSASVVNLILASSIVNYLYHGTTI
jgi:hypothetical protein